MKKLFGCVRVCLLVLPLLLVLCTITGVRANNIRVEGKTRIVNFVGADTAVIEVTLRWDNSWRDDFNWDAAWVFFKYKKRGLDNPWQHVYLSSSSHVLNPSSGNEGGGYAYMVGANSGNVNGLYVMRNGISEGNVSVRLQAKWPLSGTGLTKSDFGDALNGIYVAVHAIEMVYVPYNSYYLGDGVSHLSFHEAFGTERNPIRLNGYKSLDASSVYGGNILHCGLQNAIDNNINSHYHSAGNSDEWFMIDFGSKKEMLYFTIRTHYGGSGYYLEGSNDGNNWSVLWSGNGSAWSQTLSKHRITNPGAYQYYRFRETGNYLVIYDVALWEQEVPPLRIDSEEVLYYSVARNNLSEKLQLSASYPKGYAGFYVMKYETSQEQYVEFLNSLTLEQQKARVANNNFSTMKKGDYVFGDLHAPSCRNGIVFVEQRQANTPVVFGNNLNPGNDLFSSDDGQTLACNYMSVEDMTAYCSWSGLRPMSELEYEKACRRFYPQLPDRGEYAWNTNSGINALSSLGDLAYAGDEREQANSAAKNVNSGIGNKVNGPVRCGLFTTSATNQTQAGATYWGVMEMSGNVKELCANVNYTTLNGGSCGTGVYNANLWDKTANKYGVRGGGFSSADSSLRTSDRTEVMNYFTAITQRDSTVGFRGVYSLSGIKIDGGEIQSLPANICPGEETNISNIQPASCLEFPDVRFQYNWYVKKPGEAKFELIENTTGELLKYSQIENIIQASGTYQFKRIGICALGIAETITDLTVLVKTAITAQSQNISNLFCNGINLNLTVQGSSLTYQWFKNDENIPGANAATYRKNPISATDNGSYFCKVSGSCGTEISNKTTIVYPIENSTMTDPRDGKTYKIRKMPDGHWWMVENLRFGSCNTSKFSSYAKSSTGNQIASGYWGVCRASTVSGGGHLYNWQAAMNHKNAVYNTTGNPSGNVNSNSPKQWQGICPPGWHLPSGGSAGEWKKLYSALCTQKNNIYPGKGVFEGILSGAAKGSSVDRAGIDGRYWSSTYYNNYYGYGFYFNSSSVGPDKNYLGKDSGNSVRCVKNY